MGSIRVGLLAVVLTAASAGARGRAPKQARPTFHTATAHQKEGTPERHGPAQFRLQLSPEQRSKLADQKRDEGIAELQRIAAKFDDDSPEKPDLLFELSEFYWEKQQYLYDEEMARLDREWAAYDAAKKAGQRVAEPKADHHGSDHYRQLAIGIYEKLLTRYPKYARRDEVLFLSAYNFAELHRGKEAVAQYEQLIREYPGSRFVGDAYIQLGNHWFDHDSLDRARYDYEQAFKSNVPKIHSYALYKLAWCDYNDGQFDRALSRMQQVIAFAETRGKELGDLKNEALKDLVIVYVRMDRPDEARAYFAQHASARLAPKLLAGLSDGLADAGHYQDAIRTYRALIAGAPMGPSAPDFQQAIVHCYEGLRDRASVKKEIHVLAERYRPGSAWWKAQKDESALRSAFDVSEEALRTTVTEYHQEAQKTHQVETYKLARDIYKEYLDAFASSADPKWISDAAFNLRFYYAEILWTLEDWKDAAEQYDAVVRFKVPDRESAKQITQESYRKQAAYDAILAWDKLVKIERGELAASTLHDGQKVDESKAKGDIEKGVRLAERNETLDEAPLTRNEQKLVDACDAYAKLFPGTKDELEIRYQAAVVLYGKNHFLDAAERFKEIIRRWPQEKRSQEAADLAMHVLEAKGDWKGLHESAAEFLANKHLTRPGSDFAARVEKVVEGSEYKYVSETLYGKEKNGKAAAEQFLGFVHDYPHSDAADRALTWATILFRDQGQLDRAIAAGEQLLHDYPASPLVPKVRYTLARLYEKVADFKRSAEQYEAFVVAFDHARDRLAQERRLAKRKAPQKEKDAGKVQLQTGFGLDEKQKLVDEASPWVSDAQFDAALWWEALGKTDRAIASYRGYLARFSDHKDVPEVAFHIGEALEKDHRYSEAIRAFDAFRARYGHDKRATPAQLYLAEYHQLKDWQALKQKGRADAMREALLRDHARLPAAARQDNAVLEAYGQVRFLAVEPLDQGYLAIHLNRLRTLRRDLVQKQRRLKSLEHEYLQVIGTGAGEYGIAALSRIGQAYANLADEIRHSPTPPGLDAEQQQMYRDEIEKLAAPLEDKAVDALQRALAKAYELKLYNDWTIAAQEQLEHYRPGLYPPRREVPYQGSEGVAAVDALELAAPAVPVAQRDGKGGK